MRALVIWSVLLLSVWALEDEVSHSEWICDVIVAVAAERGTRNVALHTCWNSATTRRTMTYLNDNGMMQSWTLDVDHLPETNYEVFVVDLDCPGSDKLIEQASRLRKFTLRNKWLLLTSGVQNDPETAVMHKYPWLSNINAFPDSEVVLAVGRHSPLLNLYRVGKERPLKMTTGRENRCNLEGTKLIASTVLFHQNKFKGFYSDVLTDIDTWPKLHYPLVVNLADQLNFKLELWSTNDYGWEKNGSFSGIMGQLQRRDIDFAATGFFMRPDRIRVVEFTAESYLMRTALLFQQPPLSSVSNIFLLPFSVDVWISCAVFCVAVILIFCLEKIVAHRYGFMYPTMQNASFLDIFTIVLGCLCQQGSYMVPTRMSGRITLFFLSLASLFLYTSYSANIVALQQSPSSALSSLSDLVHSPLAVGIQDLEYNRVNFKENTDPVTRLFYEKKVKPSGRQAYCTPAQGINSVREHRFAFNVETNLGYKLISETFLETEKCGLSEIQLFPMPTLSIPLTERSGYRDLFTQMIRWQRETGILNRNGKLWLPQKPKCEDIRGGTGFVSVGLNEFLPALKVFIGGLILSVCALLLELAYHNRKKMSCKYLTQDEGT